MRTPSWIGAALCAAVAYQTVVWSGPAWRGLRDIGRELEQFTAARPAVAINPPMIAFRTLPAIAARIPPAARTLLLADSSIPICYEFYFAPRPFWQLLRFPRETLAMAAAQLPQHAHLLQMRYDQIEDRRILYSEQRLREELTRADYLVAFLFGPLPDDLPVQLELRHEAALENGSVALFAVRPW